MMVKPVANVPSFPRALVALVVLMAPLAAGLVGMTTGADGACPADLCGPGGAGACLHDDSVHPGFICVEPEYCTTCSPTEGQICFRGNLELGDHYDSTYDGMN